MNTSDKPLQVLLVVCGGIAAYKAVLTLRELQKHGCDVRVAMTKAACEFVGPQTFAAISGHDVYTELFTHNSTIAHIELADWAEVSVVVPATANIMAKLAAGIADDLVSSTLLAVHTPVVIAPAMNVHMWHARSTQTNVNTLRSWGYYVVDPASGHLACGYNATGKLVDPVELAWYVMCIARCASSDLAGKTVVITAGPTREALDPIRFISNHATGKLGYMLARAACAQKARVVLISGPSVLPRPFVDSFISVVDGKQMYEATLEAAKSADVIICTAAVGDWRAETVATQKIKKPHGEFITHTQNSSPVALDCADSTHTQNPKSYTLRLVENPDILQTVARLYPQKIVIGFAAETEDVEHNAAEKLKFKQCTCIIANDVSKAESTFGAQTDKITIVYPDHLIHHDTQELPEVARVILNEVKSLLHIQTSA